MASGGPSNAMKFYFYAIDNGNREIFLVEALIDATARAATFTAKCDGPRDEFRRVFNVSSPKRCHRFLSRKL